MQTINSPEIRPSDIGRTPLQRAKERDLQARTLDGILKSSWAMLGLLCRDVERDGDWKLLGFHSFNAWVEDALPYARSTAYDALRLIKELTPDIPESDLMEMAHDTAHVLRQLPKNVRRDPKTHADAKSNKPANFRKKVARDHPNSHIEVQVRTVYHFTASQAAIVDEALECWRTMNNPTAPAEEFLEYRCAEYLDAPWEDSGYTNRQRSEQLKAGVRQFPERARSKQ